MVVKGYGGGMGGMRIKKMGRMMNWVGGEGMDRRRGNMYKVVGVGG